MTTPRIEEMMAKFDERDVEGDFYTVEGDGFHDWPSYDIDKIKSFIHHQLQKAHQAGIDEAVEKDDLLDDMWGLICNVNGGIVEEEREEWYEAFLRIRKKYFDHQITTR